MEIVTVIHKRINALRAAAFEINSVSTRPGFVGLHCRFVISCPHINVSWHVDKMSSRRRQSFQSLGTGKGPLRMWRRLNRMNVIVIGADMIRTEFENGFKHRNDLIRTFRRCAIFIPESPGS